MDALLRSLLAPAPAAPVDSLAAWWDRHRAAVAALASTADQALAAGAAMDRLGYAFASGYQCALRALAPDLAPDAVVALCATERGGGHPRAIATELRARGAGEWTLAGEKRFVTLAPIASVLLVVARQGEDAQGRPRLRLARVAAGAPGVALRPMPATPFVPEVPHAELALTDVAVRDEDLFPGDGYERYLKPFRTREDAHVQAASLGYLLATASRLAWPEPLRERLVLAALSAREIARADATDPVVHLALAGLQQQLGALADECEPHLASTDPEAAARFARDRPLFSIAQGARAQRTARAWERVAERDSG